MATTLSTGDLFFSYRSRHSLPTTMEAAQQLTEGIEVSTVLQNGSLPDQSPARGVSGANPKLVNGEAVASDEERQVLSTQSVLKKVMTVSEAELLQSNAVDEAAASGMSSEGGGASACVSGSTAAQLKEREMSDCDGKVRCVKCG